MRKAIVKINKTSITECYEKLRPMTSLEPNLRFHIFTCINSRIKHALINVIIYF